ncbi:MAG: hypothetical protein JRE57_00115 [Deltaproteobacteria bacterium]|nr:hypothetical protein [Deltaproteobacteria bacterium]
MAAPTGREKMEAVSTESTPFGAERLVEYKLFFTDAFKQAKRGVLEFLDIHNPLNQIDGFTNDDSYRRSRHLLINRTVTTANEDNLRESSLARQLQEKKDQPATIRLVRRRRAEELAPKDPTELNVPWINLIPPNTKFFLESVQENREEKVQVLDTFGEWIAFFFGRKPEVYSYSGTLLNAQNHDWKNEFQENYDHFLRGSQAVKNRATMLLQYDDVMVEGYMLNSSIQMSSIADKAVPFTFNLLVINRSPMNPRALIGRRFERSGGSLLEAVLFNSLQESLNLTVNGRIDEIQTFLLMREYFSGNYVPGAGTSSHFVNTNNIDAGQSISPGTIGGTGTSNVKSQPFTNGTTQSLESVGAETFFDDVLGDLDLSSLVDQG